MSRKGTSADYGVIRSDQFYGVYQPYDGYPQHIGATLLSEAADISERDMNDWRKVGEQIANKKWVSADDIEYLKAGKISVNQIPVHPDKLYSQHAANLAMMVPRKSNADLIEMCLLEAMRHPESPEKADMLNSVRETLVVVSSPSWQELAAMPVATKSNHVFADEHSPGWAVTADLDAEEISIWDRREPSALPFGQCYATTELSDVDSMRELSTILAETAASFEPPALPRRFLSTPAAATRTITDGMWLRPQGYPPMPGDPSAFYQLPSENDNSGWVDLHEPCGARTLKGGRCKHARPVYIGGSCAAGHVRKR